MGRLRFAALAVCLICVPLLGVGSADEFRAEARVDRGVIGVGERLVLTIEVYGGGQISDPDMADIEGFRIVNTSSSQTLSIVNFDAVRSLRLQYVLVADAEGKYVLGPFRVQSGKEVFETEPIEVTVVKGQAPPASPPGPVGDDDAVMVRASVDKTRAYVGEQITYSLQFAYRVRLRDIQYTPPDHTGFWTEKIGETGPALETIDGKRYYVVNMRTAFFPISSGRFTIGEAGVGYVVSELRPFSFDPFDMTRGRQGRAVAEPVEIVVRQLPSEGRPVDFGGAVGTFSLDVAPSTREVKTGESLTLSVRISGRGNVKSIGDVSIPDLEGFRVFAPKARESKNVERLLVGGEKVFDFVLVPTSPGDHVIPPFEFSYFDPGREEYVTLLSDPLSIEVLPGDVASTSDITGSPPGAPAARRDIRHIKRVEISQDSLAISSGGVRGVLIAYAPALAGIVGLIVSLRRRHAATSGKGAARRAYRSAVMEFKNARRMAADGDSLSEAAGLTAKAIRAYLAVATGTSEVLIDRDRLSSVPGIGEAAMSGMADLLDVLDRIRFAPVGTDPGQVGDLVDQAEKLVRAAQAEWSK